jgi:hypothetical protein
MNSRATLAHLQAVSQGTARNENGIGRAPPPLYNRASLAVRFLRPASMRRMPTLVNRRISGRHVSGWAVLAILALAPAAAPAQYIFRLANLAYLTRRAGVIVQGRVVSVRYEPLPGYSHIPTVRVTLKVEQMLRGPVGGEYTFRQMLPPLRAQASKYRYAVGQDLMLFLPMPSRYGLSSPLGHEQGTFRIRRDAQGHAFIANELNNGGLFKGVQSDAAEQGMPLPKAQRQLSETANGPVELDRFTALVRSLATLPRIE